MCSLLSYNDEKCSAKSYIEIMHSVVAYYFLVLLRHCPQGSTTGLCPCSAVPFPIPSMSIAYYSPLSPQLSNYGVNLRRSLWWFAVPRQEVGIYFDSTLTGEFTVRPWVSDFLLFNSLSVVLAHVMTLIKWGFLSSCINKFSLLFT